MGIDKEEIESSVRISWGADADKGAAIAGLRELLEIAKQINS